MNGHFNLCHDCDFLKLYTEISSLTPIFHEKLLRQAPVTVFKKQSKGGRRKKKCSFAQHPKSASFCFNLFDWFWVIFEIYQHQTYLRYWIFALRSIFLWKMAAICSQASFQKNDSPMWEIALDDKKWGFPWGRTICWKLAWEPIAAPFPSKIERSAIIQNRR